MKQTKRPCSSTRRIAPFLAAAFLAACATGSTHYNTSVVDYLYPNVKDPIVNPGVPVLSLPLNVGIAFVPGGDRERRGYGSYGGKLVSGFSLTEKKKTQLMQSVADHFKKYPIVKSIEAIPSAYLTPRGGFANLDQIRSMYGVDVIALVSYDQTQFTDEGVWSFTYWTIVGAYVVPGEKNDTHTMLDTVVYDIASRKLLFRAPGISHIKGKATPVNLSEQLRMDSEQGFDQAGKNMIANLDEQLALFKEKVKERPQEFKVVHRPEYTGGSGGGALDPWWLAALAAAAIIARLRERRG
jgi:rhombotail lipoprotein